MSSETEGRAPILCIYHGNCADGFASAWIVRDRLARDGIPVEFHAGVYQDPPPDDIANRDIVIVDFSYKREVLAAMAERARSIIVLDHHKSAAEDLAELSRPPAYEEIISGIGNGWDLEGIAALFDMDRSGAGITWDYFFANHTRPPLINNVEDRDLYRFQLPGSAELHSLITSYPWDFKIFDNLVTRSFSPNDRAIMIREGTAILRKHDQDILNLLPVVRRRMVIGGFDVPVANLPIVFTSAAGHIMADGEFFAACYWDTPEGRVFSLRSTPEGEDVAEIAKSYGGGGHREAAGFRIPWDTVRWSDLLDRRMHR